MKERTMRLQLDNVICKANPTDNWKSQTPSGFSAFPRSCSPILNVAWHIYIQYMLDACHGSRTQTSLMVFFLGGSISSHSLHSGSSDSIPSRSEKPCIWQMSWPAVFCLVSTFKPISKATSWELPDFEINRIINDHDRSAFHLASLNNVIAK